MKRPHSIAGGKGMVQFGWKSRLFWRDYDSVSNRFRVAADAFNDWALNGFIGYSQVGSALADCQRPRASVDGKY